MASYSEITRPTEKRTWTGDHVLPESMGAIDCVSERRSFGDRQQPQRTRHKPFVIGRMNWLFANTPRGGKASTIIYSLVETAKENGLNPFVDLTYLFEKLPKLAAPP